MTPQYINVIFIVTNSTYTKIIWMNLQDRYCPDEKMEGFAYSYGLKMVSKYI